MYRWTHRYERFFAGMIVLLAGATLSAASSVTIVANPIPFASVQEAATAEERVNFWDGDPRDDAACTESFAAMELRRFLAACTDLAEDDIHLAPPDRLPENGEVFLLGSRTSNPLIGSVREAGENEAAVDRPESFRIRAFPASGRMIVIIEGGGGIGTLYGVYAYLERLGMRFYGLGEQGTVYPPEPVELPRELDIAEEPAFLTRGYYACEARGNEAFFLWMARNRMNLWIATEKAVPFLKKLGMKLAAGGHGIQNEFLNPHAEYPYNHRQFQGDEDKPRDLYTCGREYIGDANGDGKLAYAEAHPEWYALSNGKRGGYNRNRLTHNYCTSNSGATTELARNLIQSLSDGRFRYADVIDFWMLDHGPWCECERCRLQGTFTDRLLHVQHAVFQEVEKARRGGRLQREVQLATLAYLETLSPPTKPLPPDFDYENCLVTFFPISRCYAHPLADPACTEINRHTLERYRKWTMAPGCFYRGAMCIGEYYNVSSIKSLPVLYTRIMAADIPWYYRSGARHFHYMHTPTLLWGTWTLNQYLLARLLWNPDTAVDVLLEDYFRRYYPTTSERARRFYRYLERATANIKAFKHHVWTGDAYHCLPGKLNEGTAELFPLEHLQYEAFHPAINDGPDVVEMIDAMHRARQTIDEALLECTDATERLRLLEDERRFAYGEAMFLFLYHLVRTSMSHHRGDAALARHEFVYVERLADQLRRIVDVVQVAYRHANASNAFEASQAQPAYKYFKERYGRTDASP